MSSLSTAQQTFPPMVAKLITWAYEQPGYALTFGEAYRTTQQAELNAEAGTGIAHSLHTSRLAVDLNLFIEGVWQTESSAYEPMGVYWESIGGAWGGRFSKPDGNHFSLAFGGVK